MHVPRHRLLARATGSVAADRGVDLDGPGLDSANEVANVREALCHEVPGGGVAADPVVALEDQQGVPGQSLQVLHGFLIEMAGSLDPGDGPFRVGPDVEELQRDLAVQHGLQLGGGDLSDHVQVTVITHEARRRLMGVLRGPRGTYQLLAEQGRGGFGVIHRARREADGREVVVKVLRIDRLQSWKALELFEREAQVLRALAHPSIPAWIDDFALDDAGFVLVTEFVPGCTLRELVRTGARLTRQQMLAWLGDVLETLVYLHGLSPPVIHRDLTPANVILNPDGRAMLIDFGNVQAALHSAESVSSTAAGTFGYAPFEQFVGRATPASDLYGLAMTYLAVASGLEPEQMPIDGIRVDVRALLADDPLVPLLESMAEPDPRHRLADARQALRAVKGYDIDRPAGDIATYLGRLRERLVHQGFELTTGSQLLGRLPVCLAASRKGGPLRQPLQVYAVEAARLEGSTARAMVEPIAITLVARTASDAHTDGTVILVVIAEADFAPRCGPRLAPGLGRVDGPSVIVALVDLGRNEPQVVSAEPHDLERFVRTLVQP